jgi:hypothetical protein
MKNQLLSEHVKISVYKGTLFAALPQKLNKCKDLILEYAYDELPENIKQSIQNFRSKKM